MANPVEFSFSRKPFDLEAWIVEAKRLAGLLADRAWDDGNDFARTAMSVSDATEAVRSAFDAHLNKLGREVMTDVTWDEFERRLIAVGWTKEDAHAERLAQETGPIRPSVIVEGRVVEPPGWMWVLGFALGGARWAIEAVHTEEFRGGMRKWIRDRKRVEAEIDIEALEQRILEIRKGLKDGA